MTDAEKIEKISKATNVSVEDAAAAFEATGGDMLDAILLLERLNETQTQNDAARDGRTINTGARTSKKRGKRADDGDDHARGYRVDGHDASNALVELGRFLLRIIDVLNKNFLEVWRHGKLLIALPISVIALLLILWFWGVALIIIVAMFFGWRYKFSGEQLGRDEVNNVVDHVNGAADNIRAQYDAAHTVNGETENENSEDGNNENSAG
ncbi:MAG: hypothetical protein LBN02_09605 [Oscillospiraceae bacterium]|nr:hypothetical protein [Oscillospiraceae bacterium]